MAATVPNVDEIKQHFKDSALPSKGLFWSSAGTKGDWEYLSNAYALRPNVKRLTLDLLWKDEWYEQQTDNKTRTADEIHTFWDRASEAMADLNSGVAYVLLPPTTNPTDWPSYSTWARVEYPTLTKSGTGVKKICKVAYNYQLNEYDPPFRIWPQVDTKQC